MIFICSEVDVCGCTLESQGKTGFNNTNGINVLLISNAIMISFVIVYLLLNNIASSITHCIPSVYISDMFVQAAVLEALHNLCRLSQIESKQPIVAINDWRDTPYKIGTSPLNTKTLLSLMTISVIFT